VRARLEAKQADAALKVSFLRFGNVLFVTEEVWLLDG
jgi:hypothetical protein